MVVGEYLQTHGICSNIKANLSNTNTHTTNSAYKAIFQDLDVQRDNCEFKKEETVCEWLNAIALSEGWLLEDALFMRHHHKIITGANSED